MSTSVRSTFRLEVATRPPFAATRTQALAHAIAGLGIRGVTAVRVCDLYFLHGDLDAAALQRLAHWVLHAPVTGLVSLSNQEVRLASVAADEPPAGSTELAEVGSTERSTERSRRTVSYTHLTLPTSDLV